MIDQGRKGVAPGSGRPVSAADAAALQVNVVFTDTSATLAAIRRAAELAQQLGAELHVVVPHVVPYPLPLEKPAVDQACCHRHLRALTAGHSVVTHVEIRLCRDWAEAVRGALGPDSTVLIGAPQARRWRRFWPGRTERLVRQLRRHGHHVLLIDAAA